MFEYQGWATLRPTFLNSERHDDDTYPVGFEDVLRHQVDALHVPDGQIARLAEQNGSLRLSFFGDVSHELSALPHIEALLNLIVENAEGSYGSFSIIDWSLGNAERWVLRRGMLIRGPHPDFLPLQPNIEDFYTGD